MAGRAYEGDSRTPDPHLVTMVQGFDKSFIYRHSVILNTVCLAICEERAVSPWLVDNDVIEVLKSLESTMKTLSSGIYYESLPENSLRVSLFRRLKDRLDAFMQPEPQSLEPSLKVSEAIDVLNFMTFTATVNANSRPRSRQYLDMLNSMAGQGAPEKRQANLILP
jgi:hypothetical protein